MMNAGNGKSVEMERVELKQNIVYLKAECNFKNLADVANFFYSLDGKTWKSIGNQLKMVYTLPHFMGYRFGLFNYATKEIGGSADFDYFHIEEKISN
jgi:beta-xylosidase